MKRHCLHAELLVCAFAASVGLEFGGDPSFYDLGLANITLPGSQTRTSFMDVLPNAYFNQPGEASVQLQLASALLSQSTFTEAALFSKEFLLQDLALLSRKRLSQAIQRWLITPSQNQMIVNQGFLICCSDGLVTSRVAQDSPLLSLLTSAVL